MIAFLQNKLNQSIIRGSSWTYLKEHLNVYNSTNYCAINITCHKNATFLIEIERLTMTVNVSIATDQHADKEQMNVKNRYFLKILSVILTQNKKKKQRVNRFWESRLEANWNNFPLLQGRPNYIVFELRDWEKEILWVNLEVCNCSETARKGNCESDSCKANGHSRSLSLLYIRLSSYVTYLHCL